MTTPQEQSENRALLAELWHEWQPSISAYLSAAVPDFHDAEDLTQQVAIAVARDFDKYDPQTPFIRWAIVIARNRVLHHRRTKAMSKVVFSQETIDALADAASTRTAISHEFKSALDRCLEKLQGRARQAITMRYQDDLRTRQIAPLMDMTPNAVSVMLHRSREVLQQCIQDSLQSGGKR